MVSSMRRAVLLVLLVGRASAAPVMLEIDGAPVPVDYGSDGVLHVGTQSVTIPALAHATLSAGQVRGQPVIMVAGEDQAVVVERTQNGWKELVRTPVGG